MQLSLFADLRKLSQHLRQHQWISTNHEIPFSQSSPVVHRRDPSLGRLIFGMIYVEFSAFHLKKQHQTVPEFDDIIRLVVMLRPFVFIGDQKKWPIVPNIREDMVPLLRVNSPPSLSFGHFQAGDTDIIEASVDIEFFSFAETAGPHHKIVDHSHILFADLPLYLHILVMVNLSLSEGIRTFVDIKNTIFVERRVF